MKIEVCKNVLALHGFYVGEYRGAYQVFACREHSQLEWARRTHCYYLRKSMNGGPWIVHDAAVHAWRRLDPSVLLSKVPGHVTHVGGTFTTSNRAVAEAATSGVLRRVYNEILST